MPTSWQDLSEIVAGLVINHRLDPATVKIDTMMTPYDTILAMSLAGDDLTSVVDKVGLAAVQASLDAAESAASSLPVDWVELLGKAANRYEAAKIFRKEYTKLEKGEEADLNRLAQALALLTKEGAVYLTAADIDPSDGIWIPTYYHPLDFHTGSPQDRSQPGGIPKAGLTVIGAPPGTGKTSFATKLCGASAKVGKHTAFYTMEMLDTQLVQRLIQTSNLTLEERRNIYVMQGRKTADEVYADASRLAAIDPNLYYILIDFADLMVVGMQEEQSMAYVYLRMQELAIRTGVAVILLSQLNRETYKGGIPRINHLRYSGLAEALGAMILLLYNPRQIFVQTAVDDRLPLAPGRGYIIVGKSRFGFREGTPGAILVDWDGLTSWGEESFGWYPLQ